MKKSKCKYYSYDDIDMYQYTKGACIGFKNCRIYEVEKCNCEEPLDDCLGRIPPCPTCLICGKQIWK